MKSLWDDGEAGAFLGDLALRAYTSRLLGRESSLVLHGGGNTSVKIKERNILGLEEEILYVKGSGRDLASIEEDGFAPLRMERLLGLVRLDTISDARAMEELGACLARAEAPAPSIETFLHAALPHRFVDHTHSGALLAITNTEGGAEKIREALGDRAVVVPYRKPGFGLARAVSDKYSGESGPETVGIVLMGHGLFSFGDSARESYERMIELVDLAERYLDLKDAWRLPRAGSEEIEPPDNIRLAELRGEISFAAGFPLILSSRKSARAAAFARREDAADLARRGPATPDHVLRTKRLPMVGRDVAGYVEEYKSYFAENDTGAAPEMLDPAPRVVLDPAMGLLTAGRSAREAAIAADIYEHTVEIILRAEGLGGYRAASAKEVFEVEYWELERAKLQREKEVSGLTGEFAGEIALVTGAASGIGRACVESLLARGAAAAGLDLDASIESAFDRPDFLGVRCDVTSGEGIADALQRTVRRFGGVDMLVLNAGVFPASRRIAELPAEEWRRVMDVNLDANLNLMRECFPLLKLSPGGGRVVAIGSKNVPAPGRGAAAYSASKAALTQLMRVAALEWAAEGIRVNTIHPDAVFDTGVWTEDVLASRAKSYGMSVEAYKKRNLLGFEVGSRDVAEMAAAMLGALFSKTTGAQVPVDGGSERVV